MSENYETRPNVYTIPDNFFGESRMLGGRIRTRYLIDSIALSLLLFVCITLPIMLFAMRSAPLNVKAPVLVVTVGPGFLIGQLGYNGDPISVFLKNLLAWRKKMHVRLYNETPRLLGTDPVKAVYEAGKGKDKIVAMVLEAQEKRIARKAAEEYIEGKTFEFAYDPSIDGYTEDSGDYDDADAAEVQDGYDIYLDAEDDLSGLEMAFEDDYAYVAQYPGTLADDDFEAVDDLVKET